MDKKGCLIAVMVTVAYVYDSRVVSGVVEKCRRKQRNLSVYAENIYI